MRPIYIESYIDEDLFNTLLNDIPWVNRDAPRDECFMTLTEMEYTYGSKNPRTYNSVPMNDKVKELMDKLNSDNSSNYDICFLNYYENERQHLGWHADDSPEMDPNHPIAVITFGAERDIWIKEKGTKGEVPEEDRFLLKKGSLFIMPAGFQENNLHKIPKHDRPCGGRISLTFRKYV